MCFVLDKSIGWEFCSWCSSSSPRKHRVLGMTNQQEDKIYYSEVSQLNHIWDECQISVVFILFRTAVKYNMQFSSFDDLTNNVCISQSVDNGTCNIFTLFEATLTWKTWQCMWFFGSKSPAWTWAKFIISRLCILGCFKARHLHVLALIKNKSVCLSWIRGLSFNLRSSFVN